MSDEQKVETSVEETKPILPKMQYLFVKLADGRKGTFVGPELVTRAEMTLNCVPHLVSVEFSLPKEVEEPKPLAEVIQEANGDKKGDDQTAPGLEQKA